jgi:hypothetical protein
MASKHRLYWLTLCGALFLHMEPGNAQDPIQLRCDSSPVSKRLRDDRALFLGALRDQSVLRMPPEAPPARGSLVIVMADRNRLVHDEVLYHVAANPNTGEVYLIRAGGFAGSWELMGPVAQISERASCPPSAPASQTSESGG